MSDRKPNYGLDAPEVVRRFFIIGGAMVVAGVAAILIGSRYAVARWFAGPFLGMGCSFLATSGIMVWGSKFAKLRLRDKLVASLSLRGDERVLDVGCGHGLMLLGAAKKLTTGRAVGIDLWQKQDQAGNSREATLENARCEGVAERVELIDGDARQMPFEKESFDVILSSWALHNIYDAAGRRRALEEIVRVLKAGGRILITDIRHAQEYADVVSSLGLSDVKVSSRTFIFGIPSRCVEARKAKAKFSA
jgi:cyclopropane fatty-acyl-phospholipid synthase-like methyltransferase